MARDSEKDEYSGGLRELAQLLIKTGAEVARDRAPQPVRNITDSVKHLTERGRDELADRISATIVKQLEKFDLAKELQNLVDNYAVDVQATIRFRRSDDPETRWTVQSERGTTMASGRMKTPGSSGADDEYEDSDEDE